MESALKEAVSSYAAQESTCDTDPNSPFWKDAPVLVMRNDAYGKAIPGHTTEVRSQWTTKNLYFLFSCHYVELHLKPEPNVTKKTNGLWNWDVAEVFIGSTRDPLNRYKEFELSPQAEWLDLDINLEKPDKVNDPSWSSGLLVAARIEPVAGIWYGCMRIPYAAIEQGDAVPGNKLRINFFRSQGPQPVEIAWSAPLQESFHAPQQFGILRLTL
jgi:hypothetical protein